MQCHCGILTAQLISFHNYAAQLLPALAGNIIEAQAETIERILTEINDPLQLRVGGKLTNFRGHKKITENHESFYPRKFLAMR